MNNKAGGLFPLFFLLFALCTSLNGLSQVYYPVTHLSGSQSIGNRIVTVTPVNSPSNGFNCTGPYLIGTGPNNGYKFTFSKPVNYAIVNLFGVNTGEIISFYINGSHYALNSSNLGVSNCAPIGTLTINASGDIEGGNGSVEVRFLNIVSIDSIRVMEPTWAGAGTVFDFKFGGDTTVVINEPMQDTLLCSLDSFKLAYTTNGTFKSGNVFTAQLSNASGSFASPSNIGSRSHTGSDTIKCQVPLNTPTGTGYRLRIISTNPIDTSEVNIKNIAIGNAPPPNLNATASTPVCSGATLSLGATTSGSGYSWSWSGPASFSAAVQNPSVSNIATSQSGDYIVTGRLHGCAGKDTVAVVVSQSPAAVTAGSNSPLCEGATLNLTATSGLPATAYSWTGPASYSAGVQNPSRTATTTAHSGDYTVTATLNGCTTQNTITVLVKPMPAVPTANNNGPLCPGDSLGLTANSTTAGASYAWSGPGAYNSAQQNPYILNVHAGHGGSYQVTATLNGCTSAAGSTNVTVKPTPATPTAGSNTPVCAGAPLNLSATGTPGSSYSWTGPGSFTSNAQNPVIDPAALNNAGSYTVTATLNGCPSAGAGSTVVVINNVSSIGAYPSPNDTLCQMDTKATLVAVPSNGGSSPQYQWFKNGNPITGATALTYPATGIADGDTFYCRMTATGLCSSPLILFSNKIGMTVLPPAPPPAISIAASPGTLLSPWQTVSFTATPGGNAGSYPTYQWKRNGSNIIGATSNNWSASNLSDNDEISCVITSGEWCANPANAESNKIRINIKTGVEDVSTNGFGLYPNPNNGSFIVDLPTTGGGYRTIEILNAVGQVVYSDKFAIPGSRFRITLPETAPNGVYLLKLSAGDRQAVMRFTVEK